MIEWIEARSGQWVPRENGHLLCSAIDPTSEAKKWVEKFGSDGSEFDVFVILGLAGGFHIQQLALRFPRLEILVIEKNRDLEAGLVSRRGPWPENVTVIAGLELSELKNNVFVRATLRTLFRALRYPTSERQAQAYYDEVARFFAGRTLSEFKERGRLRGSLKEILASIDLGSSSGELTILDVERAIRSQSQNSGREAMIWYALRELVK